MDDGPCVLVLDVDGKVCVVWADEWNPQARLPVLEAAS